MGLPVEPWTEAQGRLSRPFKCYRLCERRPEIERGGRGARGNRHREEMRGRDGYAEWPQNQRWNDDDDANDHKKVGNVR